MAAEVGPDELVRTTPLAQPDIAAVARYYADHAAVIDRLLAQEADGAAAFVERLETDADMAKRLDNWRLEPRTSFDGLRGG
jgi:ketosteroid isomerase-like protein